MVSLREKLERRRAEKRREDNFNKIDRLKAAQLDYLLTVLKSSPEERMELFGFDSVEALFQFIIADTEDRVVKLMQEQRDEEQRNNETSGRDREESEGTQEDH